MGFTKAAQSAKMAIIFENSQNISKFFWFIKISDSGQTGAWTYNVWLDVLGLNNELFCPTLWKVSIEKL